MILLSPLVTNWCPQRTLTLILLRTEWRSKRGGRSPENKRKQRSCSPLKERKRSQTPGECVKDKDGHEVLRGILKSTCIYKDRSSGSHHKIVEEEIRAKVAPEKSNLSLRRSRSPARRWGQGRTNQSPVQNLGGGLKRRKRSPSPYEGSRRRRSREGRSER